MIIRDIIEFGLLYGTLIIFLFRYKKLHRQFRKLIYFVVCLTIGNTMAIFIYDYLKIANNLFLFHIITPLEYVTLCIVFYGSLDSMFAKKAILVSIPGFIILCILLTIYIDGLKENDSNARMVEALLSVTWIITYLQQLSTSDKMLYIKTNPLFWAYVGLMFYFLGTFFLQGLLNYVIEDLDKELANQIYSLQYLFEYLTMIALITGIFCHRIFRTPRLG